MEEITYISSILIQLLYLCPITSTDYHKVYLSCVKYFAIQESAEIAEEILSSVQLYADSHQVSDPMFHAHLCKGYGDFYLYLRRTSCCAEWYNKAIVFYQQSGIFSEEILDIQRNIIWSYIHQSDITAALSAADQLDVWLQEAPEGSKRQGSMLHLKARLEYELGHYSKAIQYDTKALEIFKALNLDMDCGSAYYVLGQCHSKNTETFDLGIVQLKKCLALWKKCRLEFSINIIDIHRMIADAYFDNNRYQDALLWYQKCLNLLNNHTFAIYFSTLKSRILLQIAECTTKQ